MQYRNFLLVILLIVTAGAGFVIFGRTVEIPTQSSTSATDAPFTQDAFAAAQKAGKPILLHVTAPWCPTCTAQKPILGNIAVDPAFKDLVILRVDFDSQKDVVRAMNVRSQSTLIVYRGANELGRSAGDTNAASITALARKTIS